MGFTRINSPLYPPTRCNKWLACLWMGAISTYWWGYLHQPTVHSITCPCPNTLARAAVYAVICLHRWYVLSQIQLYALTTNGAVEMTVIKSPTKRGVQVPGISAVCRGFIPYETWILPESLQRQRNSGAALLMWWNTITYSTNMSEKLVQDQ